MKAADNMSPTNIVKDGIIQLSKNVEQFQEELNNNFTNNDSRINIKKADCMMEATDLFIKEEDHDNGYLLQNYIYEVDETNELFVGYMNPHFLDDIIKIRNYVFTDINFIKSILQKASNNIIRICKNLIMDINKLKEPIPKKKDSKPKKK